MKFQSAIYEGWVRHRRLTPTPHEFRYALFMMYLDLDEIPELFHGHLIWGHERAGVGSFRRTDFLGDARQPLREAVSDIVEARLGRRPAGAIRLLTHLRYFGYSFNPVSVYYCYDGSALDAIVLDVRNTPWGQRHAYVLDAANAEPGRALRFDQPKAFHVSPILDMDLKYRFAIAPPGERLAVHMDCVAPAGKTLDATLWMSRRPWCRSTLTRTLFRFPWMTGTVIGAIYWQALRLWWKRVPYIPNPHETPSDENRQPGRAASRFVGPAAAAHLARTMGPQTAAASTRDAP